MLAPFREAWRQALHEWRTAYKNDVCSECSQEIQPEWHISDCLCVIDCRKCGQRIPARPWRVSIGGTIRPCRCEKIAIIAGGLFGPGLESDSNLGRFEYINGPPYLNYIGVVPQAYTRPHTRMRRSSNPRQNTQGVHGPTEHTHLRSRLAFTGSEGSAERHPQAAASN